MTEQKSKTLDVPIDKCAVDEIDGGFQMFIL